MSKQMQLGYVRHIVCQVVGNLDTCTVGTQVEWSVKGYHASFQDMPTNSRTLRSSYVNGARFETTYIRKGQSVLNLHLLTYIGEQRRLRRVCAYVRTSQSLRCSHTQKVKA